MSDRSRSVSPSPRRSRSRSSRSRSYSRSRSASRSPARSGGSRSRSRSGRSRSRSYSRDSRSRSRSVSEARSDESDFERLAVGKKQSKRDRDDWGTETIEMCDADAAFILGKGMRFLSDLVFAACKFASSSSASIGRLEVAPPLNKVRVS